MNKFVCDTNSRLIRLKWNSISALIYQIIVILGGFILPRIILKFYGSEVNGLINSITQFLSVISFLDMGVGTVVASALYKPISDNNIVEISKIVTSASKFYRKIAYILLLYIVALVVFYPKFVGGKFSKIYIVTLILAIAINSFTQYYFGIVDLYYLTAAQMSYVRYNVQIITYIINLIVSAILIVYVQVPIQVIKFTTAFIFLFRPIIIRIFLNKKIRINRCQIYDSEPIKQKWNGIAQHISFIIMQNTDVIVLTLFSTLKEVSVYSIYNLVVSGVKAIVTSITNGIDAVMGEMYAKNEGMMLTQFFEFIEWIIHNLAVIVFGCTCVLIVPFVCIYTESINDTNYIQPVFAMMLTLANASHCLRLPYNMVIQASGHYKQTQNSYFCSALINIVISVVLVNHFGLVGVAIGTFIAMTYHTIWLAKYESKKLIKRPFIKFIKQICTDVIIGCIAYGLTKAIPNLAINYFEWVKNALFVVVIWLLVSLIINLFIYPDKCKELISKIRRA